MMANIGDPTSEGPLRDTGHPVPSIQSVSIPGGSSGVLVPFPNVLCFLMDHGMAPRQHPNCTILVRLVFK